MFWMWAVASAGTLNPPFQVPEAYRQHIQDHLDTPCFQIGGTVTYELQGAATKGPLTVSVVSEVDDGFVLRFAAPEVDSAQMKLGYDRTLSPVGELSDFEAARWKELGWVLTRFSCTRIPLGIASRDEQSGVNAPSSGEHVPGWSQIEVVDRKLGRIAMGSEEKGVLELLLEAQLDAASAWPTSVRYDVSWPGDAQQFRLKKVPAAAE